MMLKCVIIDDEPLACDVLEDHLRKLEDTSLLHRFHNAVDALLFLENQPADILFLDIEMPEMSGITLLKKLQRPPLTVFTTAYRNYAFEGYELGVIDFLLKPVSFPRFVQAVEKARDFLMLKEQDALLEEGAHTPDFVFVKSGVQKIKLQFNDVIYIQGLKDYAIIHHTGGKVVIKGSVKSMHAIFPAKLFMRVHKSFIVAKSKIIRIEKSKIVLKNQHVPIGRSYKEEVAQWMTGTT